MDPFLPSLKRVYWETTAACNLRCIHCRRLDILDKPAQDELTTEEGKHLIDEIASFGRPVLIFSGGEPLERKDLFELIAHARSKSLPMGLATNGTLVDAAMARKLKEAGIYYAAVSFDGATAATHDRFRGAGAFDKTLIGMKAMLDAGIKVQINFTVTKMNKDEVEQVYALSRENKAIALFLFLLVPVGCGVEIAEAQSLSDTEVETWLQWVVQKDKAGPLPLKAICAPHYFRVEHEMNAPEDPIVDDRKGCLAGIHMCFVTHRGDVYPCGYMPTTAGNIRTQPFREIWNGSTLLSDLRDPNKLTGRCGACDFKGVCGGCRARAWVADGNYLSEEPACAYDAK